MEEGCGQTAKQESAESFSNDADSAKRLVPAHPTCARCCVQPLCAAAVFVS